MIEAVDDYDLYEQGRAAMQAGRLREAVELLDRSWRITPHFKTFELLGESYLSLKRPVDAIPFLAAATAFNAGVRAPALLVLALLRAGQVGQATDMIQVVRSRDPAHRLAKEAIREWELIAQGHPTEAYARRLGGSEPVPDFVCPQCGTVVEVSASPGRELLSVSVKCLCLEIEMDGVKKWPGWARHEKRRVPPRDDEHAAPEG
jgi:hypothetical protein